MDYVRIPSLITVLIVFVGIVASDSGNIEDTLKTYDTLHHTQFRHRIVKRDLQSNHTKVRQVQFQSLGRHFHLYLQRKENLLTSDFKIVAIDSNNHKRQVDLHDSHAYEGYVIGEDDSSEVHAVWEDDDNLSATITTADDVYVVEPSWRHLPESRNYSMIVYRRSDVKMLDDLGKSFCGFIDPRNDLGYRPYHNLRTDEEGNADEGKEKWRKLGGLNGHRQKREAEEEEAAIPGQASAFTFTPIHTTCQVKLVADYRFYQNMGKSSLSKTSSYLIGLLDRVDSIYRKTDFGNGYKGMGFEIKEIHIHEAPTKGSRLPHYNEERDVAWDTKALLEAFSRDNSYKYFCLAHLFTYQAFAGGVLGLAYIGSPRTYSVGGVCSPGVQEDLAKAIGIHIDRDYYKNGARLYLNTGWSSALNRYNRRLLTQEADLVTTHEFGHNWGSEHDPDTSECSPSAFSGGKYIMYTYSVSGYDVNNKIFSPCSRRSIGAVLQAKSQSCFEAKSMSFCGNSRVERPMEECDIGPEGKKGTNPCCDENCKLKPTAVCSDMNDLCCDNCQFSQRSKKCHEELVDAATCEGVAYCTGNNATCPPPAKKADGSKCMEMGQCKDGECLPFCETKGLVSCICDVVETSCKWCCKKDHNSTCLPFITNQQGNTTINLPDGMPCVQGSCEKGECQKQVQDLVQRIWNIIENITPDQLVEFMRANIVGTVIILSLILWIPVSCIVSWKDRKMRREEKKQSSWADDRNKLQHPDDGTKIRYAPGTRSRGDAQGQKHRSYPSQQQFPLATNL